MSSHVTLTEGLYRQTVPKLNFLYLRMCLDLFSVSAHTLLPYAPRKLHSALLFKRAVTYFNGVLSLDGWTASKLSSRSEIAREGK